MALLVDTADNGEASLTCFIVPTGPTSNEADLRTKLRTVLSLASLPRQIIIIPELPVAAGGKVDKNILYELARAKSVPVFITPRNTQEKNLFDIWEIILKRQDFGRL